MGQVKQLKANLRVAESTAHEKQSIMAQECQDLKTLLQDCLIEKNSLQAALYELQSRARSASNQGSPFTHRNLKKNNFDLPEATRTSEWGMARDTKNRDEIRNMIERKNPFRESSQKVTERHSKRSEETTDDPIRSTSISQKKESQTSENSKRHHLAKCLGDWLQGNLPSTLAYSKMTIDSSVPSQFTSSFKKKSLKYPGTRKSSPAKKHY